MLQNIKSRKLQEFEQSYTEARFATPQIPLTISKSRIEVFKVFEVF